MLSFPSESTCYIDVGKRCEVEGLEGETHVKHPAPTIFHLFVVISLSTEIFFKSVLAFLSEDKTLNTVSFFECRGQVWSKKVSNV